jgi:hypothetical protein
MTFIETALIGALLAMFTGILGLLLGSRRKITTEEFEIHRASENPHIACPVHKKQLDTVERKVDIIDDKLDRLLER